MRNRYLEKFDSIIEIKVTGINIDNYIKRIIKRKINIINLKLISHKECHIILKYKDYMTLTKIKTTYKIEIINKYGKLKIKHIMNKNKYLLIFIFIGIILLYILSNIIFSIDIIHSDSKIRALIKEELEINGIKKYTFKKNYKELEKIEDKIINNNKDKIEWLEINESGTKYIVRIEERKLNNNKKELPNQSIVASKNAIIYEISATKGEIVKIKNDYVKKGETVISGFITHPDNTKTMNSAEGIIYGETWYTIKIKYPYVYQEENLTGRSKTVYMINWLNKDISLFNFNKYKHFDKKDTTLLYNSLLNISLVKEKQYELTVIDDVYTEEETISKAQDKAIEKLLKQNKNIKKIIDTKILKQKDEPSLVELTLFIKAIEDISMTQEITEENLENTQ